MNTDSEAIEGSKENEERRTRNGQASEDRAKGLDPQQSRGPFAAPTDPEEKE